MPKKEVNWKSETHNADTKRHKTENTPTLTRRRKVNQDRKVARSDCASFIHVSYPKVVTLEGGGGYKSCQTKVDKVYL